MGTVRPARMLAPAAAVVLAACATVPPEAGSNPRDPFERVNRHIDGFNQRVDRYFLKPVAKGYVAVVPSGIRLCISSGFSNLAEIRNTVNDLLQVKPLGAANDAGRLVINSTLGVAGCFDVASRMGLDKRDQDFGLTLARYGVGTGPYLVLPLLGPSDLRDAIGLVPDNYLRPTSYVTPMYDRYILIGAELIDLRARLLNASDLVEQAALDRYQFTRDGYFQIRRNLQYEGNPPPPAMEDDSGEPAPAPAGTPNLPVQPTPDQRR
jgi:phospholipid-binding lipoprotein MlaA